MAAKEEQGQIGKFDFILSKEIQKQILRLKDYYNDSAPELENLLGLSTDYAFIHFSALFVKVYFNSI